MFRVSLKSSELWSCNLKLFFQANNTFTTESVSKKNGRWEGTLFLVNSTKIVSWKSLNEHYLSKYSQSIFLDLLPLDWQRESGADSPSQSSINTKLLRFACDGFTKIRGSATEPERKRKREFPTQHRVYLPTIPDERALDMKW